MGKYLEIAQRALEQTPQASSEDRRITKDQQLKGCIKPSSENVRREKSEICEISPDDNASPALEPPPRIDWSDSPLVRSVDKRSKEFRETPDELRRATGDDWEEVSNDPAQLVAFADSLAIVQIRESGGVPDHYNFVTNCRNCGEVPIWPGCPPQVNGCPWCLNRIKGLPMPGNAE